jgi:hypothetical protein
VIVVGRHDCLSSFADSGNIWTVVMSGWEYVLASFTINLIAFVKIYKQLKKTLTLCNAKIVNKLSVKG